MTTDEFLAEVYRLANEEKQSEATDLIFDHIDRLMTEGSFDEVDKILNRANTNLLNLATARSLLIITDAAKGKLLCRRSFLGRACMEFGRGFFWVFL